ncbi:hypothetical protein PISL3812_09963 [Talaromyces islandicus]|uniref:HTH CENPB-type domain-containing protein n=1 Tax=Talaromyces islandicus TaxID=28573 RepID=A0A0U1MBC2_TALIS|nr:hypothetical protein PISL3812_09963 [Talaromyces islandicus]
MVDGHAMPSQGCDYFLTDMGNYGSPSMEAACCMSLPPSYSTMPLHLWPSKSSFPESSPAPPHPPLPTPSSTPTPRRTLTNEERRKICQYREDNKAATQIDIGAHFGVDRSTVSKILRRKEEYLGIGDGTRSPIKKNKGKVPDLEKAIVNWARNYQRQKILLTDAMIEEKARRFAEICGEVLTPDRLQHFKQKINPAQ